MYVQGKFENTEKIKGAQYQEYTEQKEVLGEKMFIFYYSDGEFFEANYKSDSKLWLNSNS